MITPAFIERLLATSEITDLVGNRIKPNVIKSGTPYPAIYVFSDRMEKQGCFDPRGAKEGVVEIGVYAKSYSEAYDVMQAIRLSLDDFTGIINNVGIMIMGGKEAADQYNEDDDIHLKIIEYEAVAEPKN